MSHRSVSRPLLAGGSRQGQRSFNTPDPIFFGLRSAFASNQQPMPTAVVLESSYYQSLSYKGKYVVALYLPCSRTSAQRNEVG